MNICKCNHERTAHIDNVDCSVGECECLGYRPQDRPDAELLPTDSDREDEIVRLLYDFTPGGSEFHNDPKNCIVFITRQRDSQRETLVQTCKRRNELRAELTALRSRADRLERALRHYADNGNWICPFDSCTDEDCSHPEQLYMADMNAKGEEMNGYDIATEALKEDGE